MNIRVFSGAVICLASFGAAYAAGGEVPRDPEAFTGYVVAKLQPEISTVPVSAAGTLTITIGPISSNISRLYSVCQSNPGGCDEAIRQTGMQAKDVLGVRAAPAPQ